jgi:hypothetical protein
MPRLAPTIDNSCTKMATWNPSIPENYPFRPINIKTAPTTGLKWPPWAALDCQIWQFEVHTLNGRSGFFHSNQGLKVFPSWRQDCPLPPPINRSRFHVRSKEKLGVQKSEKTSLLPCFYCSPLSSFSLYRGLQPPSPFAPVSPPSSPPQVASPTTSRPPHAWNSHRFFLSLTSAKSFFLPSWSTPATVHPSDATETISSASWSHPWPPLPVVLSSANLHFCSHFGCMQNVNHCSRSANN